MKKVILMILAVVALNCTAFAEECFNSKGSAVVPGIYARYNTNTSYVSTSLNISNITDKAVTCRVTVYDQDGNDVSTSSNIFSGGNGPNLPLVATGTGTFQLPANSTRMYTFFQSTTQKSQIGYAVIDWTSTDTTVRKALVATMRSNGRSGDGTYHTDQTLINNGMPF